MHAQEQVVRRKGDADIVGRAVFQPGEAGCERASGAHQEEAGARRTLSYPTEQILAVGIAQPAVAEHQVIVTCGEQQVQFHQVGGGLHLPAASAQVVLQLMAQVHVVFGQQYALHHTSRVGGDGGEPPGGWTVCFAKVTSAGKNCYRMETQHLFVLGNKLESRHSFAGMDIACTLIKRASPLFRRQGLPTMGRRET